MARETCRPGRPTLWAQMLDLIFLTCFIFGALFTAASVLVGSAGLHGAHLPHAGGHGAAHVHQGGGAHSGGPGSSLRQDLTSFNFTGALAFITWFGAAGYVLLHTAGWVVVPAIVGALLAGVIGWVLIALFFHRIREGEREMDPADYRLVGTVGRLTAPVGADVLGEVLFTKGGTRRSEAARSLDGKPIARDTEVVITAFDRGIATVEPWAEFLATEGGRVVPEEAGPAEGRNV